MSGISIIDIIIVSVLILAILFGLWRGMFKMLYGLISTLLALVIAVVLVSTVVTFVVDNTVWDDKLSEALAQPISSAMPSAQQLVSYYDLDNDPETPDELGFDRKDGNGARPFSELFQDNDNKLKFLESVIKIAVENNLKNAPAEADGSAPSVVVMNAISSLLTTYILCAAAFIVLWILLYIIIRLLCMLFKKLVTQTYIGYYLNKVLGCILGAVLAMALVFGFLTVIRLMGNYEVVMPVNNIIEESSVAKFFADNNILYNFIADKIDVQSIVDKIMESISKAGTAL